MKCPTCGNELKTVTVQVPVYVLPDLTGDGRHIFYQSDTPGKIIARYDEEEQVCDCPRCQGGY